MNKKGAELSMNLVIIAVLAIIVFVIVVIFVLGGFGASTSKIKNIFFGTLVGTDRTIAVQTCQTRCEQAKLLPVATRAKSSYCKDSFYMDEDGNGEADKDTNNQYIKFYCSNGAIERVNLGVDCNGLLDEKSKQIICP